MRSTKKMVFLAILTSLSVILGIIDAQIAGFFAVVPGAKIGLANIVLILSIMYFGFKDSLLMAILKSLLVGLLLGAISTFFIGFVGTMFSFFGMYLLHRFARNLISIIGISIVGAVLHAIGQILAVMTFYQAAEAILFAPQLILVSIVTGVVTGILTKTIEQYVEKAHVFDV